MFCTTNQNCKPVLATREVHTSTDFTLNLNFEVHMFQSVLYKEYVCLQYI